MKEDQVRGGDFDALEVSLNVEGVSRKPLSKQAVKVMWLGTFLFVRGRVIGFRTRCVEGDGKGGRATLLEKGERTVSTPKSRGTCPD